MAKKDGVFFDFESTMSELFGSFTKGLARFTTDEPTQVASGMRSYRTVEEKDGLVLEIDLPGVASSDVSLWVDTDQVIVKASKDGKKFTNRYTMSTQYNVSTATAKMANGQLRVRMARTLNGEPRRVPIDIT